MRVYATVICGASLLVGCTGKSSSSSTNYDASATLEDPSNAVNADQPINNVQSIPPTEAQAPAHNYSFTEGEFYGYVGAVSDDDQKRGVGAPPVVRFRYTGFWDGEHHLQAVDDNGSVISSNECAVPCVAIKETMLDGSVRRVGYSTTSIIGVAFEDAINGQLLRSPPIGAIQDGYRFKGGDPGNTLNWRMIAKPSPPAPASGATSDLPETDNATDDNVG